MENRRRGNKKIYPHPLIGERIEKVWVNSGMSAKQFTKYACGGMERKSLYAWINSVSSPNAMTIRCICEKFHVSADWLLGLDEGDEQ